MAKASALVFQKSACVPDASAPQCRDNFLVRSGGLLFSLAAMNPELILALDIGTSSTRTALFDVGAERLAGTTAQQTYPLITTADGGAEVDPPVLLGAVLHCLEQTLRAVQANTLAGTGDEDRGYERGHERLASR